ncbi:agc rsk rskp90 protein kinase [Plasmopara halstedii]|uniref:Agc rsk rskp90 protein kinase n=1 Tax=Plasmopara halstedii TaxID=4781 RepID=A0A0N7L822_PLAHL|nr:agc rsk rskp90 protein kinase [Plasmopara halstedii]CEG48667.1 agc rsk rskp90 protein kinase [Plasmopara halstedii]|eukprot:XP_024585036.1 agc rsk rskp90 protein kinase [Plasmopara halstedii]
MNILRLPEPGATASGDKAQPTSCEGYVTKRGHFRKSWRVRFLVLDGSNLQVAYYESRAACHPPNGESTMPKGSFYLSNIEPHEYVIGVMGAADRPFGFKMVGHAPRKGFVELDVFVETQTDRNKWLEVACNALKAKRQLTRQAIDQSVSPNKKKLFGFSVPSSTQPVMSPQKQMQTLATSKEGLLLEALREIEAAKLVGREACNEIVNQGEKLDVIEQDLSAIDRDLDFGDKLLHRLKSPTLHFFSDDTRPKVPLGDHPHHSGSTSPSRLIPAIEITRDAGVSDLQRLAQALGELEVQAELLNSESGHSSQQIERIEHHLSHVTERVEKQTKQAVATLSAGPRLF